MIQCEIPFASLFNDTSIHLQNYQVLTTITSLKQNLIGICNSFNDENEIKIYKFKDGKWGEYLKQYIKRYGMLNILCFNNDNNQLLFCKRYTDSIECLTIKKTKILGMYTYINGAFEIFYKFLRNKDIVRMIPSNNQQFILIQTTFDHLLFDIRQKTIIMKFERESQNQFLFYDNHYLMNIQFKNSLKSLQFYKIDSYNKKTKAIKMLLCLKILNHTIHQQLNNCLVFTGISGYIGEIGMLAQKCHFVTLFNIINLKLVRRIILPQDYYSLFFVGLIEQYMLLNQVDNQSNKSLQKIDLLNFQIEISKLNKSCTYQNQILRIQGTTSKYQKEYQRFIRK